MYVVELISVSLVITCIVSEAIKTEDDGKLGYIDGSSDVSVYESQDIIRRRCVQCPTYEYERLKRRIDEQDKTIKDLNAMVEKLSTMLGDVIRDGDGKTKEITTTIPPINYGYKYKYPHLPAIKSSTYRTREKPASVSYQLVKTKSKVPEDTIVYKETCPAPFQFLKTTTSNSTKHCYYFGKTRATHHQAKRACRLRHSRLAEFTDEKEYEVMKNIFIQRSLINHYWVGGVATKSDPDKFIWERTFLPINDTYWLPSEPSSQREGRKERCVSMDGRNAIFEDFAGKIHQKIGLNDESCSSIRIGYLCQM